MMVYKAKVQAAGFVAEFRSLENLEKCLDLNKVFSSLENIWKRKREKFGKERKRLKNYSRIWAGSLPLLTKLGVGMLLSATCTQ